MTPALAIYLIIGCLLVLVFERIGAVRDGYERELRRHRYAPLWQIKFGILLGCLAIALLWPVMVAAIMLRFWREVRRAS